MNQADDRETIEQLMLSRNQDGSRIMPLLKEMRKEDMKKLMTGENGLGKFLKFKLSTTAVGGRANLSD